MDVAADFKSTEAGIIPVDWLDPQLQQITDDDAPICYGIVQVGKFVATGVPVLAIKNLNRGYSDLIHKASAEVERAFSRSRVIPGDVLVSVKGTTGRVGLVPEHFRGNISRDLARIRLRRELHSPFIYHMLRSGLAQGRLAVAVVGTTRMELSIAILKQIRIPLPPSLAEQEAIAEALSDADALIESLEQLLAKKRNIKQGAMQELLTGKKRLPGFSGAWAVKRLGNIAAIRNEKVNTLGADIAAFCVELEQIGQDTGRVEGHSDARTRVSVKYRFNQGDVLFGRLRPYLRKFWHAEREGVCSTEIWPLIPIGDNLISTFLYQIVRTDGFIEAANSSYGTHMPRSDWKALAQFQARIPSENTEQAAIATVLSDMDVEIASLEAKLTKARAIKQGMMQELLTGRIRLI